MRKIEMGSHTEITASASGISPAEKARISSRLDSIAKMESQQKKAIETAAKIIETHPDALTLARKRNDRLLAKYRNEGSGKIFRIWQHILSSFSRQEIATGLRETFPEQIASSEPITIAWKFKDRH